MTLFEKIIARQIPADIVYEDDLVLAFRDISPKAPTHVLIVPKKPIPNINNAKPEDEKTLGHLLLKAAEVARKAHTENLGLKEAALALGFVSADDFERWVRPEAMVRPTTSEAL